MTEPKHPARFAVTVHHANKLKVWMKDSTWLQLSADRNGITQCVTLHDLTADQMAAIIKVFGEWDSNSRPAPPPGAKAGS